MNIATALTILKIWMVSGNKHSSGWKIVDFTDKETLSRAEYAIISYKIYRYLPHD